MIKVTFEFDGVDQAIVALGKLVGVAQPGRKAPTAPAGKATAATPAGSAGVTESGSGVSAAGPSTVPASVLAAPTATPPKTRKPRSDAGQPRGPHKPAAPEAKAAGTVAPAANPGGATPGQLAVPAAAALPQAEPVVAGYSGGAIGRLIVDPATDVKAAPLATPEEVQVALEKLFTTKGEAACHTHFAYFDVKRGRDLKPEQRALFIAKVNETLAA